MEPGNRTLNYPLLSCGDKRPLIDDREGAHPKSKRQRTQPFENNPDFEPAIPPSYIYSSLEAQNGISEGSIGALRQSNLDADLPGYFEAEDAAELFSLSDWPAFGPECPGYETLSAAIPIQSSQVERWTSGSGFSIENFTDASPFNTTTQTDSELNVKFLLDDKILQETATVEESNATLIKKDYVRDDYSSVHTQFASDCPGDEISQLGWESTSQTSGISAAEAVDKVVQNEMTDLGQSMGVALIETLN
jgi:hypothetical protein